MAPGIQFECCLLTDYIDGYNVKGKPKDNWREATLMERPRVLSVGIGSLCCKRVRELAEHAVCNKCNLFL